jgi:hypothetical protein
MSLAGNYDARRRTSILHNAKLPVRADRQRRVVRVKRI